MTEAEDPALQITPCRRPGTSRWAASIAIEEVEADVQRNLARRESRARVSSASIRLRSCLRS